MAGIGEADGSSAEKLGYLGLGMMGLPMTRRLINAGHDVTIWNRSSGKAAALVEAGAKLATHPRNVATAASIIFICLTDATAVEEVVFGSDGLAMAKGSGKLVVDFSSIHPNATRAIAARLKAKNGMGWIDAPVSGGTVGAEQGTLAVKGKALCSCDGAKTHAYGPLRRGPNHQTLQSGDRRMRDGGARGGDAAGG
jgi:3-hydroxyisobutyrate dehydrogenase